MKKDLMMSEMYRDIHSNSRATVYCPTCRRDLWIKNGEMLTKYGEGCADCREWNPLKPELPPFTVATNPSDSECATSRSDS